MVQLDSYIIISGLGGLTSHDKNKTSNPIQNRHRHTNKAKTMITICFHSVVHATQISKALKILSNS